MGPDLARAAGLSVPELLDFVSGVTRLSQPQLTALGRKMGLVVGAETGIDKLRAKLVAMMRKRTDFGWLEQRRGGRGEENLRSFMAGENCLTLEELDDLAKELFGKHMSVDPSTAALKSNAPPATPMCGPGHGVPWANGSNVPFIQEKAIANARAQLARLEQAGGS